jgi:MFS family permease
VVILYNITETLQERQPFSFKLLQIAPKEWFEITAIKPAFIMLLFAFGYGSLLTLVPDLSVYLGLKSKGVFYACFTLTALLVRFVAGKSSDKHGRIAVLFVTALNTMVCMILLSFVHNTTAFLLTGCLFGLSHGMYGPTIAAWTVDLCSPENRGKAVASM